MPPFKPRIKQEESQPSVMQKYCVARVKLEVKGRILCMFLNIKQIKGKLRFIK